MLNNDTPSTHLLGKVKRESDECQRSQHCAFLHCKPRWAVQTDIKAAPVI